MTYINIEHTLGSIDTYTTDDFSGYLIDSITKPSTSADKTDNDLWSFYSIINKPELSYTGKPRRCANNCKAIYALCLDYDGGAYLDGVSKKFAKYEHYIYSSFRHLADGRTEKFRMILPLDKPYDCSLFEPCVQEYLVSLFNGCDKTTFSRSRTFYMPCMDITNKKAYTYRINKGVKYSLDETKLKSIIKENNELLEKKREQYKDSTDLRPLIIAMQNKVNTATIGELNNTYWKAVYCLSQHGMNGSEIYYELVNFVASDMYDVFRSMCKRV